LRLVGFRSIATPYAELSAFSVIVDRPPTILLKKAIISILKIQNNV
jgi:hypothetical protein